MRSEEMKSLKENILRKARLSMIGSMLSIATISPLALHAQGSPIYITPLFEYPVAPEELPDLQSKSEYVLTHFWDNMDFGSKSTVDQNALNHAFEIYTAAMPYSSAEVAMGSVNTLIKKLKGNPTLTLQFTKAAEETLYGPRAEFWSDDIYGAFLKNVISDKDIAPIRKARYERQQKILNATAVGKKFPQLRLTLRDGRQREFKADKEWTLIEIGNPDCDDCRFAKTKLSMASDLQDLVEEGKLEILFIVADAVPEEQADLLNDFASYPEYWTPSISYGADDILDIRYTPSFYLLGKKGEILGKNMDVNAAIDKLRESVSESKAKGKAKK